ncbi:MAG: phosphate ABC transporter permease PstA [Halobacteriota archaeon]|uniref:phosphate ABC transporter permease PstA n=1 Tax=Natronomonas sp. TaxID=2184060 RepID=UPI003975808A
MATEDKTSWWGEGSSVSRVRGVIFEYGTFFATLFGILMVAVLLVYVSIDAFRPFTADPMWHLTYLFAFVIPSVVTWLYLGRKNPPAQAVGQNTLSMLIGGLFVAAGLVIVLVNVYGPISWFAVSVSTTIGIGAFYAYLKKRPRMNIVEQAAVFVAIAIVTVTGVPAIPQLGVPKLLSPLWEFILGAPFIPTEWAALAVTLGPIAGAIFAPRIGSYRKTETPWTPVIGTVVIAAAAVGALAATIGWNANAAVVVFLATAVPIGQYLYGVSIRDSKSLIGLALPVVVIGALAVGIVLTETLGFTPPNAWLDWDFLTSVHSRTAVDAGIYPALVGSVLMILVIAVSAFPVGVGAAIYLEEYAPSTGWLGKFVRLIKINIGNLAGVPSVVYGMLGLALIVRAIGLPLGTVIVGGFTVGLLILPIIIISAQEAIRAVPDSMRQASYGMGATRWQTTKNVVLPEAMPGILTGTILALGRAIGETAPLILIGAATTIYRSPDGIFSSFSAMPKQIHSWVVNYPQADFRYGVMAAGVVTLLVVLLGMNAAAIIIRNKYQRRQ